MTYLDQCHPCGTSDSLVLPAGGRSPEVKWLKVAVEGWESAWRGGGRRGQVEDKRRQLMQSREQPQVRPAETVGLWDPQSQSPDSQTLGLWDQQSGTAQRPHRLTRSYRSRILSH